MELWSHPALFRASEKGGNAVEMNGQKQAQLMPKDRDCRQAGKDDEEAPVLKHSIYSGPRMSASFVFSPEPHQRPLSHTVGRL